MKTLVLLLLLLPKMAAAFHPTALVVQRRSTTTANHVGGLERTTSTNISTKLQMMESTTLVLAEESWRQYVPLVVSALVIVDILSGSPVANAVLGRLRAPEETEETDGKPTVFVDTKGERVDTTELANAAVERARNALEWNTERAKLKSDYDRMEDIKRKMDNQMREFDEKQIGEDQK